MKCFFEITRRKQPSLSNVVLLGSSAGTIGTDCTQILAVALLTEPQSTLLDRDLYLQVSLFEAIRILCALLSLFRLSFRGRFQEVFQRSSL